MENTTYATPYTEIVKQEDVKQRVNEIIHINAAADYVVLPMNMDGDFYPRVAINSKQGFSGDLIEVLVEASLEHRAIAVIVVAIVDNMVYTESQRELASELQNSLTLPGVVLYDFILKDENNYFSFMRDDLV